jgi:DNA-binding SARP family transcriptional activator
MFVRLMGAPAVGDEPDDVTVASGLVPASVLAVLAMSVGRTVTVDQAIGAVWDDPPASARNAVQVAVSRLRDAFGKDAVSTTSGGYRLGSALTRVDLLEIDALAGEAQRLLAARRPVETLAACDAALALAADEPLVGLRSEWTEGVRGHIGEQLVQVRLMRAQSLTRLGRASEAVSILVELGKLRPLDEGIAAALMRALAVVGRHAEALGAYDDLRKRLADELGVDPSPETQSAFAELLEPARLEPLEAVPVIRLPRPAGPTWGRDEVIAAVAMTVVDGHRLVSIVGPGGIGKTRVAVAAARRIASDGGHSAWFIDLTAASDAADVAAALDSVIDPTGSDHAAVLGAGSHVVVLDNAEHLLGVVTSLAPALLEMGDVRIVATSRVPLDIVDERTVWLGQLDSDGRDSPAAQLLVDRARAWMNPLEGDIDVLTELAGRVDGVPLALELLGAALRWHTPAELLVDFESELRAAAAGGGRAERHHSVTAAIDWNLRAADGDTRRALGALTVLGGDFSVRAATAVLAEAAPAHASRDLLSALVDLSLVQRVAGAGEVRLRILQPVRIAIRGHPLVPVPDDATRSAHARYFLNLVVAAVDALETTDAPVVDVHRQDDHNVGTALEWAWAHDRAAAFEALGHVMYYWYFVVRADLVDEWSHRLFDAELFDSAAGARCGIAIQKLHVMQGIPDRHPGLRAAIEAHLPWLDLEWTERWRHAEAERLRLIGAYEEGIDLLMGGPEPTTPRGKAARLAFLTVVAATAGDTDRAVAAAQQILDEHLSDDQPSLHTYALSNRGYAALTIGDLDRAAELLPQAVAVARATTIRDDFVLANNCVGWLHVTNGQHRDALATIAASVEALGTPDDLLFLAEILLVSALAMEGLRLSAECDRAVAALREILSDAPPGVLDAWAGPQAAALLARRPALGADPVPFGSLKALLAHATEAVAPPPD